MTATDETKDAIARTRLEVIRERHAHQMMDDYISQETEDMGYVLAALEAINVLAQKAWAGDYYVLPGGYPSRPVEAFDIRKAITDALTQEG